MFVEGRVRLSDSVSITISGPFDDAVARLQSVVDVDHSGPTFGHTWKLAWGIVWAGIIWPGWERYHDRLRHDYLTKLGDMPQYRDAVYGSESQRKKAMWEYYEQAQGLSRNHYMPEGVQLPDFVEGPAARPCVLRQTIERAGLSDEVAREWFLKSLSSQRLHRERSYDFTVDAWHILRDRGLVVGSDRIPLNEAVRILSLAEMRSVIKQLGLEAPRTLRGSRDVIVAAGARNLETVASALVELCGFANFSMILPPDGIDWLDFQSWRQQIRGMAEAVTDLSIGGVRQEADRAILLDL